MESLFIESDNRRPDNSDNAENIGVKRWEEIKTVSKEIIKHIRFRD